MSEPTPREQAFSLMARYHTAMAKMMTIKTEADKAPLIKELRDLREEMIQFRKEHPDV